MMSKWALSLLLVLTVGCERRTAVKPVLPHAQVESNRLNAGSEMPLEPTVGPALAKSRTEQDLTILRTEPKSPPDFRVRVDAVKALGHARSIEAIPGLIQGLVTIRPFSVNNVADLQETYPCAVALSEIGEPAVPSLVSRFEEVPSGKEQLLLLNILFEIKGKDWLIDYLDQLGSTGKPILPKAELQELRAYAGSLRGS
jgi:hypothetical protein